ncbi:hypothetical protein V8G54_035744 [Vigna mungo]|uniref:Uncharacterized protein n=1 Tax=Vigna mungo TaxID=3915 RepID=A0AAQ3MG17_VIGMU
MPPLYSFSPVTSTATRWTSTALGGPPPPNYSPPFLSCKEISTMRSGFSHGLLVASTAVPPQFVHHRRLHCLRRSVVQVWWLARVSIRELPPSRADETDNWGTAKKPSGGFERRVLQFAFAP